MRMLLHSPKDTLAGSLAVAAVSAIVANALFLQTGRHPSPMFGTVINLPAPSPCRLSNPLPRPRPVGAEPRRCEPRATEFRRRAQAVERAAEKAHEKPVEPTASTPRAGDPMTNLVKATTAAPPQSVADRASAGADPVAARAAAARRIAGVQRALTEYGYGQLKTTGTIGAETQAAIQKFERERKMPVTGQVSDRLVRELASRDRPSRSTKRRSLLAIGWR